MCGRTAALSGHKWLSGKPRLAESNPFSKNLCVRNICAIFSEVKVIGNSIHPQLIWQMTPILIDLLYVCYTIIPLSYFLFLCFSGVSSPNPTIYCFEWRFITFLLLQFNDASIEFNVVFEHYCWNHLDTSENLGESKNTFFIMVIIPE